MGYVLIGVVGVVVVGLYALIAGVKHLLLGDQKRVETMSHEIAAHYLRSRGWW